MTLNTIEWEKRNECNTLDILHYLSVQNSADAGTRKSLAKILATIYALTCPYFGYALRRLLLTSSDYICGRGNLYILSLTRHGDLIYPFVTDQTCLHQQNQCERWRRAARAQFSHPAH